MKMSRRALRMQRNHKRNANKSGLNLTALMDIFTILVFFLMVNQAEVEVQGSDAIQLPASLADNKPADQVTIMVSQEDILVQGRVILSTRAAVAVAGEEIPELKQELEYLAARSPLAEGEPGRPVTIMGDKNIAYTLLKKVMNTCAKAQFNHISLAVNQTLPGNGGGG